MAPTIEDLEELDIRVGTVTRAEPNTGARDPAYRLWVDFGDLGTLQSSAKITDRYAPEDLVGRHVVAVTGFDPVRVGGFRSDVLILGALDATGVVLLAADAGVPAGTRIA
jgi:tRNA-binding protein